MCLIIHRPRGHLNLLPEEFFADVWSKNSDGWGIMYLNEDNPEKVEVGTVKSIKYDTFWATYKKLEEEDREMVIHFRMATHGTISDANAHPFEVVPGMYMVHNGTIDHPFKARKNTSDTVAFVDQVVKPIVECFKDPEYIIRDDAFLFLLEKAAGANNRLVFMDKQGITFVNKKHGHQHPTLNVWVSNSYAYSWGKPEANKVLAPVSRPYGYTYGYGSVYDDYDYESYNAPSPTTNRYDVNRVAQQYEKILVDEFFQNHAVRLDDISLFRKMYPELENWWISKDDVLYVDAYGCAYKYYSVSRYQQLTKDTKEPLPFSEFVQLYYGNAYSSSVSESYDSTNEEVKKTLGIKD